MKGLVGVNKEMSQKDYELLIYNQIRNLEKVKAGIKKSLPFGSDDRYNFMLDIHSIESDLRIKFGNNRKLDYLLSLK